MNFSDLFKQTAQLCEFSPNGKYLANAVQYQLVIRDKLSLEITHIFKCLDTISYLEWSSDSEFILCSLNKRNIIQVFSLENPEWKCKIDEGSAGLAQVNWSPDSRHILTTSDFHIRITVWSLTNKSVSYMKYPKNVAKCYEFSKNGKYMLLAERRDCKDYCSIFVCDDWQLLKHFEVDTDNLEGISWSPNCVNFAVWESPIENNLLVYNLAGQCINKFHADRCSLGVKSISWSPSGQILSIGYYDQKVRLLNHITYKVIMEFEHPSKISSKDLVIFKETDARSGRKDFNNTLISESGGAGSGSSSSGLTESELVSIYSCPSKYEIFNGALQIAAIKPDLDKPNPKMGVNCIQFSCDNRFMCTRNDSMPNILWIWDMTKFKLTNVLIQASAIRCVSWDPSQAARLALCTNTNKLYMWSPQGCVAIEVPCEATFLIQSIRWCPATTNNNNKGGSSLLLVGKEHFCMAYIQPTTTTTSQTEKKKQMADNTSDESSDCDDLITHA